VMALPDPATVAHATKAFVAQSREYAWSSAADALALQQIDALWADPPAFTWINLILPDAANHAGGPYSDIGHAGLRDTDARLGAILDRMDWGQDATAFILLADHGMEASDPACTGDFDQALARAGIPFRDEGYGFIYLDT
jgi:phosphonoacetate hydrolase